MRIAEYLDQFAEDGARLAHAATSLDADVPACPQWTVRDLVWHVGGVHRWASSIVRDRLDHDPEPGQLRLGDPGTRDVVEWFCDGHASLLHVLRDADPALRCYTFLPAPSPLAFWARRQAHETAIHRADVESAGGPITPFPAEFAIDGIEELLAFAARRPTFRYVDAPRTLAIRPDGDDGWQLTLAPDGVRSSPGAGAAEATVGGSASDLYLWSWNRPAAVTVDGDPAVARLWRHVRIR